jgi:hypothetical protein
MKIYGRTIEFSHRPLANPIDINVHGHLHNCEHRDAVVSPNHYLVNIEETLAPINLRRLLKI